MTQSSPSLDDDPRVGYDPLADAHHAWFDPDEDDSVPLTVIETVAVATGQAPESISLLASVVDPDALDRLVAGSPGGDLEVTFAYEGCMVRVTSAGEVVVSP